MTEVVIFYLLAGLLAGTLSGWFGLGGGMIAVPTLATLFHWLQFPPALLMHLVIGTSLTIMVFTTAYSLYKHQQKKHIDWSINRKIIPFIILGAFLSTSISHFIPGAYLRYLFIVFNMYVLMAALLKKGFSNDYTIEDITPPPALPCASVGLFTGCLASLLGVGGSLITIPFFRRYHFPMKMATGLAVSLTVPVALAGACGAFIAGYHEANLPIYSTGFIYWPAVAGMSLGSLCGVPLGLKLLQHSRDGLSARIYILLLIGILIKMCWL